MEYVLLVLVLGFLWVTSSLAQTNISGIYFSCSLLTTDDTVPSSVHMLKPSNIRVIGAMGNNFVTGRGALDSGSIQSQSDYRGLSWAGGGDANLSLVTTVPNILRIYNPDLFGYARGGNTTHSLASNHFNLAQEQVDSGELVSQARKLVRKMRENDKIDFVNDWKIVTVYADSNDQCSLICTGQPSTEPSIWIQEVTAALDYLRDNLPRTLVNLVQLINIQDLYNEILASSSHGETCRLFLGHLLCNCTPVLAYSVGDSYSFSTFKQNLENLVESERYDSAEDFTVVLQPFLERFSFREVENDIDMSPFNENCYSLGAEGHHGLAIGLWNNMFEKVGRKSRVLQFPVTEVKCPTEEQPFITTSKNSLRCSPPLPPSNGYLLGHSNETKMFNGDAVMFQCNEGYVPRSSFTSMCSDQGIWTPDPLTHICDLITATVSLDFLNTTLLPTGIVAAYRCGILTNANDLQIVWTVTIPEDGVAQVIQNVTQSSIETEHFRATLTEVRENYIESVLLLHPSIDGTQIQCGTVGFFTELASTVYRSNSSASVLAIVMGLVSVVTLAVISVLIIAYVIMSRRRQKRATSTGDDEFINSRSDTSRVVPSLYSVDTASHGELSPGFRLETAAGEATVAGNPIFDDKTAVLDRGLVEYTSAFRTEFLGEKIPSREHSRSTLNCHLSRGARRSESAINVRTASNVGGAISERGVSLPEFETYNKNWRVMPNSKTLQEKRHRLKKLWRWKDRRSSSRRDAHLSNTGEAEEEEYLSSDDEVDATVGGGVAGGVAGVHSTSIAEFFPVGLAATTTVAPSAGTAGMISSPSVDGVSSTGKNAVGIGRIPSVAGNDITSGVFPENDALSAPVTGAVEEIKLSTGNIGLDHPNSGTKETSATVGNDYTEMATGEVPPPNKTAGNAAAAAAGMASGAERPPAASPTKRSKGEIFMTRIFVAVAGAAAEQSLKRSSLKKSTVLPNSNQNVLTHTAAQEKKAGEHSGGGLLGKLWRKQKQTVNGTKAQGSASDTNIPQAAVAGGNIIPQGEIGIQVENEVENNATTARIAGVQSAEALSSMVPSEDTVSTREAQELGTHATTTTAAGNRVEAGVETTNMPSGTAGLESSLVRESTPVTAGQFNAAGDSNMATEGGEFPSITELVSRKADPMTGSVAGTPGSGTTGTAGSGSRTLMDTEENVTYEVEVKDRVRRLRGMFRGLKRNPKKQQMTMEEINQPAHTEPEQVSYVLSEEEFGVAGVGNRVFATGQSQDAGNLSTEGTRSVAKEGEVTGITELGTELMGLRETSPVAGSPGNMAGGSRVLDAETINVMSPGSAVVSEAGVRVDTVNATLAGKNKKVGATTAAWPEVGVVETVGNEVPVESKGSGTRAQDVETAGNEVTAKSKSSETGVQDVETAESKNSRPGVSAETIKTLQPGKTSEKLGAAVAGIKVLEGEETVNIIMSRGGAEFLGSIAGSDSGAGMETAGSEETEGSEETVGSEQGVKTSGSYGAFLGADIAEAMQPIEPEEDLGAAIPGIRVLGGVKVLEGPVRVIISPSTEAELGSIAGSDVTAGSSETKIQATGSEGSESVESMERAGGGIAGVQSVETLVESEVMAGSEGSGTEVQSVETVGSELTGASEVTTSRSGVTAESEVTGTEVTAGSEGSEESMETARLEVTAGNEGSEESMEKAAGHKMTSGSEGSVETSGSEVTAGCESSVETARSEVTAGYEGSVETVGSKDSRPGVGAEIVSTQQPGETGAAVVGMKALEGADNVTSQGEAEFLGSMAGRESSKAGDLSAAVIDNSRTMPSEETGKELYHKPSGESELSGTVDTILPSDTEELGIAGSTRVMCTETVESLKVAEGTGVTGTDSPARVTKAPTVAEDEDTSEAMETTEQKS